MIIGSAGLAYFEDSKSELPTSDTLKELGLNYGKNDI